MKRLSLLIIPISLLFLGVFVFTGTKDVKAAYGDRASYKLSPWTFWQTGVTTEGWNGWELNSFNSVVLENDSDKYDDSVAADGSGKTTFKREYYRHRFDPNSPFYHKDIQSDNPASLEPYQITLEGTSHSFTADIENNGWSGKWIEPTTEPNNDPPKWGETTATPITTLVPPTTTKREEPIDNDPYTLRCWATASQLKKNRSYTWVCTAYIDAGARMAKDPDQAYSYGETVPALEKYVKIVGTNSKGTILFVRYMVLNTSKKEFRFNFSLDSSSDSVQIQYMFGAFIKVTGPVIKHKEVCWVGKVHLENCDIIQGNLNEPQVETTTRRSSGGGGDSVWYDEPEKITGVKAKSKAKKSITLSWSREENSTKYQYNYALKKNFKGGKKKYTTKNKVTIKKLKRKKTYHFRVRGMNDEYTGSWSSKKKCKVK